MTNDPALPEAHAVLVNADGTIADVLASLPADTIGVEVVQIPGQLALPGLHDAHAHLNLIGLARWGVDLKGGELARDATATGRGHSSEKIPIAATTSAPAGIKTGLRKKHIPPGKTWRD